ncbi:glycosyl hydrolase 53 family protein [Fibrobacter sp.]|uniref:glycosyl hydrolase 53 family protein n=1 Tax=Fibrobacter sp. TaxID=35828 RepID=UPI0038691763
MGLRMGKFGLVSLAAMALCACGDDTNITGDLQSGNEGSVIDSLSSDSLSSSVAELLLSSGEEAVSSSSYWSPFSSSSYLWDPYPSSSSFWFRSSSSFEGDPPPYSSSEPNPFNYSSEEQPRSSAMEPLHSSSSGTPAPNFSFYNGADISTVQEYERWGAKFYDVDGTEKDIFTLLKDHGFNAIRLKTFVSPKAQYGYAASGCDHDAEAYADKDHIIAYAEKIKAAGMAFLLDIHYSDNWADPGKQIIPSRWRNVKSSDAMADSIYNYTYDLISSLKQVNATPEMVQIGNETTPGILIHVPNSKTDCWGNGVDKASTAINGDMGTSSGKANAGKYFKAGIRAVKAVSENIKTVLHIESIRKTNTVNWWMEEIFKNQKVPADVMGFSAYTAYGDDKPDKWNSLFKNLTSTYSNLEFIVAEYNGGESDNSYSYDGSRKKTVEMVRGLNRWIGTFFWEPTLSGAWGPALFDWDGPDLRVNKKAFDEYKVEF